MSRGGRLLLLATIAFSAASRFARAEEAQSPPSVSYLAGPNCPDAGEFWGLVAAHRRNPSAAVELPVRVEVSEVGGGEARARVAFSSADATDATRELSASTCSEAAQAAALVVALAFDARAEEHAAQQKVKERKPTPTRPKRPVEQRRDAQPQPAAPRSPDSVADSSRKELQSWLFGGGALVQQAIAPTPLFGVTAFVGLAGPEFAWQLGLGGLFAQSGVSETDDAAAEFALLAARVEACAFPLVRGERFVVDPCLAFELGSASSSGVDSQRFTGEDHSSLWAAGGPLLRAGHGFGALWLDASFGPWFPVAGTFDYVFEDQAGNRSFHRVSPVGFAGAVRLAARLD